MTGVTTFFINDKIDTGIILMREGIQIFPFENAGDLHDRMMKHGARLVIRTLASIADKSIIPHLQSDFLKPGELPREAPKIFPEDCIIDWNKNPVSIHNLIRGLAPYPGARSFIKSGDKKLSFKIFDSYPECIEHNFKPGFIVSDGKHFMKIAASKGFLNIVSLQVEGKNRMSTVEFLRGFNLSDCAIVS
jgi:methionyl-tRNA formyltransferase